MTPPSPPCLLSLSTTQLRRSMVTHATVGSPLRIGGGPVSPLGYPAASAPRHHAEDRIATLRNIVADLESMK